MKSQRSSHSTLILFLVLLEIVIGVSWVVRIQHVEPLLRWEDNFISFLSLVAQNYQLYKIGIFVVIFLIIVSQLSNRRKPRRYKLPKM